MTEDTVLGTGGSIVMNFVLPRNDCAIGSVIGWPLAIILGVAIPTAALRVTFKPKSRH